MHNLHEFSRLREDYSAPTPDFVEEQQLNNDAYFERLIQNNDYEKIKDQFSDGMDCFLYDGLKDNDYSQTTVNKVLNFILNEEPLFQLCMPTKETLDEAIRYFPQYETAFTQKFDELNNAMTVEEDASAGHFSQSSTALYKRPRNNVLEMKKATTPAKFQSYNELR